MRRIGRRAATAIAVAVAASGAAGAGAAPLALTGWPVLAPAGGVYVGPSGGAVAIGSDGADGGGAGAGFLAVAHAANGRRLWREQEGPGCGNCDDGPQVTRLQPNGSYGPIGFDGDFTWAVDQAGRRVTPCSGAVLADGTCISVDLRFDPPDFEGRSVLQRVRPDGATAWEQVEPDFSFVDEFSVPPVVVADGDGAVYTSFGDGFVPGTSQPAPARLIAVDAATGTVRWRVIERLQAVAALPDGVLARGQQSLVAFDGAGARRWTLPLPGEPIFRTFVAVDGPRSRVYVQTGDLRTARVVAVEARTGTVVWRTAPKDFATLLSVAGSGLVLVSTQRDGLPALRAIGPDGRGRWLLRTATQVIGAAALPNGSVALSQGGASAVGLLLRVDPRRAEPRPPRPRVSLRAPDKDSDWWADAERKPSEAWIARIACAGRTGVRAIRVSRRFAAGRCPPVPLSGALSRRTLPGGSACVRGLSNETGGTILRVASPRAAALRVRLLRRNGTPLPIAALRLRVPAGRSFVGVAQCSQAPAALRQVEVTLAGRVTRIPVRLVPAPVPR